MSQTGKGKNLRSPANTAGLQSYMRTEGKKGKQKSVRWGEKWTCPAREAYHFLPPGTSAWLQEKRRGQKDRVGESEDMAKKKPGPGRYIGRGRGVKNLKVKGFLISLKKEWTRQGHKKKGKTNREDFRKERSRLSDNLKLRGGWARERTLE